ncbi:6-phosphofructokinase, partial [Paenarthrobacter ureafaciens]|uniref:6-phosphofructokinase n=1 Tax=Paenarthrobacter ureafaciens TaxID=37931 RepID=UPI00397C86E9
MRRLGILTSGGDCPGVNAVIRGAVLAGVRTGQYDFVGYLDGWSGVLSNNTVPLTLESVRGLSRLGGTILGTSRTNPITSGGAPADRARCARLGHLDPGGAGDRLHPHIRL